MARAGNVGEPISCVQGGCGCLSEVRSGTEGKEGVKVSRGRIKGKAEWSVGLKMAWLGSDVLGRWSGMPVTLAVR